MAIPKGFDAFRDEGAKRCWLIGCRIKKVYRQMIEVERMKLQPHLVCFQLVAFLLGLGEFPFKLDRKCFARSR